MKYYGNYNLNHKVKDFEVWKRLYDSDSSRREAAGLKEIKVSTNMNDSNHVFLIWETDDLTTFNKMLNDPDLKVKMEEGGVVSAPEVTILS